MLTLNIPGFSALEALELMYAGLEVRHRSVREKINELRVQIAASGDGHASIRRPGRPLGSKKLKIEQEPAKQHHMSKESRQKIIEAQQLRWKRYRREKNAKVKAENAKKALKPLKSRERTRREPPAVPESASEA